MDGYGKSGCTGWWAEGSIETQGMHGDPFAQAGLHELMG